MKNDAIRVRRRAVLTPGLLLLLFALCGAFRPQHASAHAQFDHSDPPANSVLSTPPARMTLFFTEPVEHTYSRVELFNEKGEQVNGAANAFDDSNHHIMNLTLPATLPNGTYSAVWRTLSAADGHRAQGYVAFTIGSSADIQAVMVPADESSDAPSLFLQTIARWLPLVGLSILIATWPIWLLVLRPAISPAWQAGPTLTRRVRRVAVFGALLALGGSLVALLVQASGSAEGSLASAAVRIVTDTRYGRMWVFRIALILVYCAALMLSAWWWPRRQRTLTILTFGFAFLLPLPFSLISHASALTTGRATAIVADAIHLGAAGLWIGGLVILTFALLPTLRDLTPRGRRIVLSSAVRRFSAVALAAWVMIGITGLYSAWLHVGDLDGLFHTSYGHTLTAKMVLVVPVLIAAAYNLLIVSPRLRRSGDSVVAAPWIRRFAVVVAFEAIVVLLILFTVGRLTSQSPARDDIALAANQIAIPLDLQGHRATLTLAPGKVGPNHYVLEVAGDPLDPKTEAVIRLETSSVQTGEKEIDLTRSLGNRFEWHGAEFSFAGDWQFTVIVRVIGSFQWTGTATVPITSQGAAADLPRQAWHFSSAGILGLILLALGLAGLGIAFHAGKPTLRRESAGLGTVALLLGTVILVQSRISPVVALDLSTPNPIAADSASIERGAASFAVNCTACHGVSGHGDGPLAGTFSPPAADFTTTHARAHLDAEFFNWIKNGKPPTAMPAFGGKLSDNDIWDVINYLREIQRETAGTPVASPVP